MHTLRRVVFLCGTCGCVPLLVLLVGVDQAVAHTWNIEVADDGKLFSCMTDRHLRLDAQGRPHIAYGEDRLYYAFHDGLAWNHEVADSSYGVGTHASLALDDDGWPHISYTRAANGKLKYAYRDASGWHVEMVDAGVGYCGGQTSLALDDDGYAHISYSGATSGDLKYACRDASGWHIETVDLGGWGGLHTSLAVGPSGCPHISYYEDTDGDLKYAHRDSLSWHIETVDAAGDVGRYTSLALDGSGRPHISYFDQTNGDLKHAYREASGWQIQAVDETGYLGLHTSLALDGSGYPHISYFAQTNGDLKYAYGTEVAADEVPWSSVNPAAIRLLSVSPNPASAEAAIIYSLGGGRESAPGRGCLRIFDRLGRLVAAPGASVPQTGTHSIRWDLTSLDGRPVAPGVYYLRLEAGGNPATDVRRLVIIR